MKPLILLLLTLSVPCFADTPFDSSHDFELFTCDTFISDIGPQIMIQAHGEWTPDMLFWNGLALGADLIYRAGENDPVHWNDFWTIDLPANLLGTLINVRF